MWVKTIALQLGINEESVENEIEPLLLKSWIIEKTGRGRILKNVWKKPYRNDKVS
jgi:Holliday junction resolvasome RuvABC ATP-dependent DNA helicase subunit